MKLTKEQKKWMNTLTEEHLILIMEEAYFSHDSDIQTEKAEARRNFRAGYIAGLTNRNEKSIEDV